LGELEREIFDQIIRGDNNATGMDAVAADGAFQAGSVVNDLFGGGVGLVFFFEVGVFDDGFC
jgi:hypothetical protein